MLKLCRQTIIAVIIVSLLLLCIPAYAATVILHTSQTNYKNTKFLRRNTYYIYAGAIRHRFSDNL